MNFYIDYYFDYLNKAKRSTEVKKTKKRMPLESKEVLQKWYSFNIDNPYLTQEKKQELSKKTGLSIQTISRWVLNTRFRKKMVSNKKSN